MSLTDSFVPLSDAAATAASLQNTSVALARDVASITETTNAQLYTMSQVLQKMLEVYRDGIRGFLRAVDDMTLQGVQIVQEVQRLNKQLQDMQQLAEKIKATVVAVDILSAQVNAMT